MSQDYMDIDITFKANPVTGDINVRYDDDAIKQSINLLLQTGFYDRTFSPQIGSNLNAFLFNLNDISTQEIIEEEIRRMLREYEPRVRLEELFVDTSPQQIDSNALTIRMRYTILNAREPREEAFVIRRVR